MESKVWTMVDLNMSLNELRPLVLESFKRNPNTQYLNICNAVASIAIEKGYISNPQGGTFGFGGSVPLSGKDEDNVREIIWNLIIERVVTIGMNSSNTNWPWLSLTKYGLEVAGSAEPVPHDPTGYLKRIKQVIPQIDPIILTYLEESLNTYNINALLSSTIALGCASEKALLLLIDSYANAIQETRKKAKFINETKGRMIKRQFDEFSKCITTIIGNMPRDISDGLNTVLLGIFEMIRNNRNDAGHPTGKSIPKEYAFANLQVFIPYCQKIYQLIEYFDNNPV
jgi:hypothetical protein